MNVVSEESQKKVSPLVFVLIFIYICRPVKKVYFVVVLRQLVSFNVLFVRVLKKQLSVVNKISFGK